jgi:anoctamin-8
MKQMLSVVLMLCCECVIVQGPLQRSKVTGNMEPHYPSWKRNVFRYCVSIPLIVLSLGVVFATMLSIFMLQDWLNDEIKEERFPSYVGIAPKVLLAVSIGVFDDVYKKIAYWLNNKGSCHATLL